MGHSAQKQQRPKLKLVPTGNVLLAATHGDYHDLSELRNSKHTSLPHEKGWLHHMLNSAKLYEDIYPWLPQVTPGKPYGWTHISGEVEGPGMAYSPAR